MTVTPERLEDLAVEAEPRFRAGGADPEVFGYRISVGELHFLVSIGMMGRMGVKHLSSCCRDTTSLQGPAMGPYRYYCSTCGGVCLEQVSPWNGSQEAGLREWVEDLLLIRHFEVLEATLHADLIHSRLLEAGARLTEGWRRGERGRAHEHARSLARPLGVARD